MSLTSDILKLEKQLQEERKQKVKVIPEKSLRAIRPILEQDIMDKVMASMASIKHKEKWEEWGFQSLNSVVLFQGPPGTGKSTTARWIAKNLRCSLIEMSMADIGGGSPGDTERAIRETFKAGIDHKSVILMEECDALLWDRSLAGPDSLWMLGVINCILTEMERYPYVVLMTTNHFNILDPALKRRITFEIDVREPGEECRRKLWAVKWPKWPLDLEKKQICKFAKYKLNGAYIEKVIQEEARYAIIEERNPSYQGIIERCQSYTEEIERENTKSKRTVSEVSHAPHDTFRNGSPR